MLKKIFQTILDLFVVVFLWIVSKTLMLISIFGVLCVTNLQLLIIPVIALSIIPSMEDLQKQLIRSFKYNMFGTLDFEEDEDEFESLDSMLIEEKKEKDIFAFADQGE